jgi:hypothetical protein
MRSVVVLMLIALTGAPALAEEVKTLKTIKIHEAPEQANLYAIDKDGTVLIDWEAVETLAASQLDRTFRPTALLMLAIRDGKWKPIR